MSANRDSNRPGRGDDQNREPTAEHAGDAPDSEKVSRIPDRGFGNVEIAEAQAEQAEGRRESMKTRDNMFMGPHDQEFSQDPRVNDTPDDDAR